MAKKVEVILKDASGKKTTFKSKTLTKLFNNKDNFGKLYEFSIKEPEKSDTVSIIGNYIVQGKGTTPPPEDKSPVVDAGEDLDAKENVAVVLDGNATDDGTIVEMGWVGPDGIALTADPQDRSKASFTTPTLEAEEALRGLIFTFSATDDHGHTSTDQAIVTVRKDVVIPPPPPDTDEEAKDNPGEGMSKVYDSRDFFGGEARTVYTSEGSKDADSGGVHINASGKPRLHILGDKGKKHSILECLEDGHGRFYTRKCNYDASLVRKVRFLDDTVDNDSTKIDSRHQYRDEVDKNASDEETQGGTGNAWHKSEVDAKIEVVHGGASACSFKDALTPNLKKGEYYKTRFTVLHNNDKKEIKEKAEIEYPIGTGWRTVLEKTCTSAPDQFFNESQFMEWSEYWNRINGKGRIEYEYIKLYRK